MKSSRQHTVHHWKSAGSRSRDIDLLCEEPLSIRIQGKPYAVVMRTPGDEIPHVAGFCLSEGIVDTQADFVTLGGCEEDAANVVTVTLKPHRAKIVAGHIDRRGYISQTSCGICGKEIISDLLQAIPPLKDTITLDISKAATCLQTLSTHQPLRNTTKAAHGAALFGADFRLLAAAEDVGRHNAMDKAIGKLLLENRLDQAVFMVLSSRISYELVQKAGRAKIPIILAKSRPTALAVSLASELNLTLVCQSKESGILVFCGEHRLKGES